MADKAATTTMGRGGFRGGRGRGNFRGRGNSRGRGRGNFRGQHHHHHDASSAHQQPPTIVTTTPTATITAPTHHKQAQSFKVVSTNTPHSPEKVVPASHITISNASNHTTTTTTNAPTGLKKPEFTKVAKLQPGTKGHNLVLKVVDVHIVVEKKTTSGSALRVAEAIVGDETGVIVLSAKNEQIDVVKRGASIVVRNGRVDVFNKKMRLRVDSWGLLQTFENGKKAISVPISDSFTVNTENNVSVKEYDTVYEYE